MINTIKTYFLLGILMVIFVLIGSFFGRTGMYIAFFIALAINWFSYFFSDRLVLAIHRAKEITYNDMPSLHNAVSELTQKEGLPMPKLYLIPSDTPNAFATGRNPKHSAVAVTSGILNLLTENELKGVLSHELSHIKHRDILIATIAATFAVAITMLARMMQWAAILGGGGDDNRGGNVLGLVGMLAFAILAPIAAMLVQFAISRSREYLADEGGARMTGRPGDLADALRKISAGVSRAPMRNANPATAHMFIIAPFSGKAMLALFSTHPPVEERIRRLENLVF
jgi:heat shock protein HtpX